MFHARVFLPILVIFVMVAAAMQSDKDTSDAPAAKLEATYSIQASQIWHPKVKAQYEIWSRYNDLVCQAQEALDYERACHSKSSRGPLPLSKHPAKRIEKFAAVPPPCLDRWRLQVELVELRTKRTIAKRLLELMLLRSHPCSTSTSKNNVRCNNVGE